ncbi:hypothetical protein KSP40_PGU014810 [Platanthera guangdongensis]|uniref:Uncharacterized protein n=1 Tax=Platanthera guangdongensis TaxID=2320717 RepID=A0ABR2LTE6_9ASPA
MQRWKLKQLPIPGVHTAHRAVGFTENKKQCSWILLRSLLLEETTLLHLFPGKRRRRSMQLEFNSKSENFRQDGGIDCNCVAWVPGGKGLFVAAHADGNLYVYSNKKDGDINPSFPAIQDPTQFTVAHAKSDKVEMLDAMDVPWTEKKLSLRVIILGIAPYGAYFGLAGRKLTFFRNFPRSPKRTNRSIFALVVNNPLYFARESGDNRSTLIGPPSLG